MRFCTFEANGPKTGLLRGKEYILDLQAIDNTLSGDVLSMASDPETRRRIDKIARGEPPQGTMRRVDKAYFHAPLTPERMVLVGGVQDDIRPTTVVGPGGEIPKGSWSTGVAAVIRHRIHKYDPDDWMEHVLGFTVFHRVGDAVCLGPWVVGMDEIHQAGGLGFSAFVDDEPRIRPTKALLDWGAEIGKANDARVLRAGDLVALAAPPSDVEGTARSALVYNGTVLARLVATLS